MLTLLLGLAAAQSTPCEEFTRPDTLEGEHFNVEWDPSVGDAELAQDVLEWAEQARSVYTEQLGYDFTERVVLIRLQESPGAGGLTITAVCPDTQEIVPHINLFATGPGDISKNTTQHEVVHGIQYAYMGTYLDSITSWAWWMEGHATWLTWHADHDRREQTFRVRNYLEEPWTGLHQDPTIYSDPVRAQYLYGTSLMFLHLERDHGHEVIRQTWEYGATQTGTPIYLPDALEAAGVDFHDFWLDHMAEVTVMDTPESEFYIAGARLEDRVSALPASGAPKAKRRPGGLGLSVVHFRKGAGAPGGTLTVHFSGDPEVEWMAALVRTKGNSVGSRINEVVELEVGDDGTGTASMAFDGTRDGWLVVSPMGMSLEGHDYSWTADPVLPVAEDEEKAGCGCNSAPGPLGWVWLLPLVGFRLIGCGAQQRPEVATAEPDPPVEPVAPEQDARDRLVRSTMEAPLDGRPPITDSRVLHAMRTVPRHRFVPEEVRAGAYADSPLPIGHDQTISQPYIVALMTQLAAPEPGDTFLEVGTGSGYQAAVLAGLVKQVYTIEIVRPLAERAAKDLAAAGYANVEVRTGDGYAGWPEHAPFDGILVTAAPDHVPEPLKEQLAVGGRMVIPVGPPAEAQELRVLEKRPDGSFDERIALAVAFVPLTGER